MDFILLANNKSGNSSVETAGSLAMENNNVETAGSIAYLTGNKEDSSCGFDAFGGKDLFGSPDFSNVDGNFFTSAENSLASAGNTETAGSLACADYSDFSASTGDCGASASASAGGDFGGCSCDSGFSSVC